MANEQYFFGSASQLTSQACLVDLTAPTFSGVTTVTPQNSGAILAAWSAATEAISLPIEYNIYISPGSVSAATLFALSPAMKVRTLTQALIFTLNDQATYLVNGLTYTIGVRSEDGVGNVDSNVAILTTTAIASGNLSAVFQSIEDDLAADLSTFTGYLSTMNTYLGTFNTYLGNLNTYVNTNLAAMLTTLSGYLTTLNTLVNTNLSGMLTTLSGYLTTLNTLVNTNLSALVTTLTSTASSLVTSAVSVASSAASLVTSATSIGSSASSISTSATSLSSSATSLASSATSIGSAATSIAASATAIDTTETALAATAIDLANTETDLANTETDLENAIAALNTVSSSLASGGGMEMTVATTEYLMEITTNEEL